MPRKISLDFTDLTGPMRVGVLPVETHDQDAMLKDL